MKTLFALILAFGLAGASALAQSDTPGEAKKQTSKQAPKASKAEHKDGKQTPKGKSSDPGPKGAPQK